MRVCDNSGRDEDVTVVFGGKERRDQREQQREEDAEKIMFEVPRERG